MYRQYENPCTLQQRLEEAKQRLAEAFEYGNEDDIISAHEDVEDIKERINFAWQDATEFE